MCLCLCSIPCSEKKQLASVWTREQEEELEELFHRYKDEEDGERERVTSYTSTDSFIDTVEPL